MSTDRSGLGDGHGVDGDLLPGMAIAVPARVIAARLGDLPDDIDPAGDAAERGVVRRQPGSSYRPGRPRAGDGGRPAAVDEDVLAITRARRERGESVTASPGTCEWPGPRCTGHRIQGTAPTVPVRWRYERAATCTTRTACAPSARSSPPWLMIRIPLRDFTGAGTTGCASARIGSCTQPRDIVADGCGVLASVLFLSPGSPRAHRD